MPSRNKFILLGSISAFLFLLGCSGSNSDDGFVVKKKNIFQEEYSSITGIQKKSLINQSNLETLTNIVSEYKTSSIDRDQVMMNIIELFNTPYLWGGTTSNGIDCSAFVLTVYRRALGINLPRTSIIQSTVGKEVKRGELQFGDLVFFITRGNRISHVGIYLGESIFAQSSSNGGVKLSSLDEDYYNSRYVTARRIIE